MSEGPAEAVTPYRYASLDALRGIAALAVVMKHFSDVFQLHVFQSADIAVDFFFVLSGFVVSLAYKARLQRGELGGFALARFARLYPLILLGSVLGLASFLVSLKFHAGPQLADVKTLLLSFAATLLLVPTWFPRGPGTLFPINIPFWSMFAEAVANAAYGLLFPILSRTWALASLCAVCSALAFVHTQGQFTHNNALDQIALSLVRVGFGFFAGVLLERFRPSLHVPLLVAGAALLLLLFPPRASGAAFWLLSTVAPVLIVALSIRTRVTAAWETAFSRLSGRLSYPVYAIHYPFVAPFAFVTRRFAHGAAAEYAMLFVFTVSVLGAAAVAEALYDRPTRAMLLSAFKRAPRGEPAASLP